MKYNNKYLKISCDGGAATGKTTGAKMISAKYKLQFLSSGLLYRYVGFLIKKNKPKNKFNFIKKKFKSLNYNQLKRINLHTQEISKISAEVAKNNKIRNILKKYQLSFAKKYETVVLRGEIYPLKYCLILTSNFFRLQFRYCLKEEVQRIEKKIYKIKT